MIALDIIPDCVTLDLLRNGGKIKVTTNMCVELIHTANSLHMIDFILNKLLYPLVKKHLFLIFDDAQNNLIKSKVLGMDTSTLHQLLCHQLYVFRMHYLCFNVTL